MERRQLQASANNFHFPHIVEAKSNPNEATENAFSKGGQTENRRLQALRDLGNQLQIKAERMRLLARAEEGLEDADYNPYVTQKETADTHIEYIRSNAMKEPSSKIPVSSARQRHREKKFSKKASKVDIRQYRPGYTWNKGGRVRELRIRTLARKFLNIWTRKTFGRVTPSQASKHYRSRILKLVFSEWYMQWWEARREWRLIVRAECHHRYVLWLKTFRSWKEFVVKRRVRNTKLALAEQHGSCKLSRKCLDAWIVYTECRRHKQEKKQLAFDHHSTTVLRSAWSQWRTEHDLVQHRQHMEVVAMQFWAYRIQTQHWLIWQERLSQRRAAILNQFKAARHNHAVNLRKCFRNWLQYWMTRREKNQEKVLLKKLYDNHLKQKMFRYWSDSYRTRKAIEEHQEKMDRLAETFQLRRIFVHWQHYVHLQHEKQLMIADAEDHYERKLLFAGLSGFQLAVVQRRIKRMRQELADQHRDRRLMLWAWNQWLSRCEDNEELKIITETRRARRHYRKKLMQKCFDQLHYYSCWRKHRESQYARADAHHYMHVMPQCLFRMKIFVQVMKNNRENGANAEAFRRENVQARFFYQWVNMYEFSKEYRMNERMAILHYDDKVLKRMFSSWKLKTAQALQDAENEEIAADHYKTTLCRSHLMAWKLYIDELKTRHRHEIVASRHYCERGVKRCMEAWRKFTIESRHKHTQTNKAVLHYSRTICKKLVAMWLHYVDTQRAIKLQVEAKYALKCQVVLRDAFHEWRENATLQIEARQADRHADHHHSGQLLAKVLKAWHRYAAIHAYKKSETRHWVESATEELNSRKLRIYFIRWQVVHSETALDRLQCVRADHHHNARVKHAVLQIWKTFTKENIKKKLLQKQSDWFHDVRLTARYFIGWKHSHQRALAEKEKTNIALWHWCLTLHRKVLIGWFMYAQQRKQKKQRIADAMERRRCRLLRDGVTQWLLVANDLTEMRMKFAAQQQAKSAYETSQLVLRAGLHWKHWAQRQVKIRGGPKPLPRKPTAVKQITPQPPSSLYVPYTRGPVLPGPSISAPVSARSEGHQAPRSRTPVPELSVPVSAVSPARSTKSEYGRGQLRARPRRPDFLVESLKRAGLFSPSPPSQSRNEGSLSEGTSLQVQPPTVAEHISADQLVERLNLSGLSGDRSDTDKVPLKYTPHVDVHIEQEYRISTPHLGPLQSESDKMLMYTGATGEEKGDNTQTYLPKGQTNVPKLLTPADFMSKHIGVGVPKTEKVPFNSISTFGQDINREFVNKQMGDNSVALSMAKTPQSFGHSECNTVNIDSEPQSVASTPRVLCQSAEHSHPLYETYSFTPGDVREATSICSREVTPKHWNVKDEVRPSSTQDVQKEIIHIRNRLKSFDQKKKKLRTMQKHMKQLSDWLREEEVKGHSSEDEDILNAKQEVQELSTDVSELKKIIEEEKALCSNLVDRVKILTAQLTLS